MESLSEIIRQTRLIGCFPEFIAKAELFELAWRRYSHKNQDSHASIFIHCTWGGGIFLHMDFGAGAGYRLLLCLSMIWPRCEHSGRRNPLSCKVSCYVKCADSFHCTAQLLRRKTQSLSPLFTSTPTLAVPSGTWRIGTGSKKYFESWVQIIFSPVTTSSDRNMQPELQSIWNQTVCLECFSN